MNGRDACGSSLTGSLTVVRHRSGGSEEPTRGDPTRRRLSGTYLRDPVEVLRNSAR